MFEINTLFEKNEFNMGDNKQIDDNSIGDRETFLSHIVRLILKLFKNYKCL